VGFHNWPIKTEQRRSSVDLRIQPAFYRAEGIFSEQTAELAAGVYREFTFQHREDTHGQALAGFQNNVADKAIADHNIDVIFK